MDSIQLSSLFLSNFPYLFPGCRRRLVRLSAGLLFLPLLLDTFQLSQKRVSVVFVIVIVVLVAIIYRCIAQRETTATTIIIIRRKLD